MSTPILANPRPDYDDKLFPFIRRKDLAGKIVTESSVSIPPALWIHDDDGAVWTLGFDYDERAWRGGQYEYDVVRNGRKTGEFARIIEAKVNSRGNKVVKIWGADGWRTWRNGKFV